MPATARPSAGRTGAHRRGRAPRSGRPGHREGRVAVVGIVTAGAALLLGGVAGAAWSSSGSGASQSQAGTAAAPVVRGVAVSSGLLYPAGTGDAAIAVTNPNPYPVRVVQVAGRGPVTGAGGTGTCATTGVTFTTQNPGTLVAAGATATVTLPGAVAMSNASETGCQNATFTTPVSVTVESAG